MLLFHESLVAVLLVQLRCALHFLQTHLTHSRDTSRVASFEHLLDLSVVEGLRKFGTFAPLATSASLLSCGPVARVLLFDLELLVDRKHLRSLPLGRVLLVEAIFNIVSVFTATTS